MPSGSANTTQPGFMPPAKNGSDGAADGGFEVLPLPPARGRRENPLRTALVWTLGRLS